MNESAFPIPSYVNADGETHDSRLKGMDLRDYFAAKAMQALIYVYEKDSGDGFVYDCADSAYFFADVMIKARGIKR